MKKYLVAFIAPIVALGAASCSEGQRQAEPPQIGPVSRIESPDQIDRPTFPYTVSADQATTIQNAVRIGTENCMRGFGFSLALPKPPDENAFVRQLLYRSADYGFFDPAADPSKGYDMAAGGQQLDLAVLDRMPADERAVLEGAGADGQPLTTYHGTPVPAHGCGQVGLDAIGGRVPIPRDPGALPDNGPAVPPTDPRIVAVNKQWSDCMQGKGFHYASPVNAYTDPRWRATETSESVPHSPDEIATAAADLACKQSVNLVGVVVAVETAYDQRYIASHTAALQRYQVDRDSLVRQASAIIAAHPDLP